MAGADLRQLYQDLREVARRQLDALAAEDFEAFSEASEARERAFEQVRRHEAAMPPAGDPRLAEIRELIRQILADDEKIAELATRAATQARAELATITQGMNALNAYANEAFSQSYFIDRSS